MLVRSAVWILVMEFVSRDLAKADDLENDGVEIHFALIETCLGCRLLNLPEVDGFIKDDFTKKYSNTILKTAPGQSPVLHLLDKNKKAIRSIDIVSLTRIELNNILLNSGIPLKDFGKSRRKAHDL